MNRYVSGLLYSLIGISLLAWQIVPLPPDWQWERVEMGLQREAIMLAVAAHPSNPDRLWAGYYAPGGLITSRDGGQSWVNAAEGLADNPIFDLLVVPSAGRDGAIVWAATPDGLFWRDETGESWQPARAGLPGAAVFTLAADGGGRLYIGLDSAGIYAESPDKSGWVSLSPDEPLARAGILSLVISPDGQQLYAGTSGQGLFASRDGGQTWKMAYPAEYVANLAFSPDNSDVALASLRDRLVRTRDGGQSWQVLATPWEREWVVSLLWLADGTVSAGTARGRFYQSRDSGMSWVGGKTDLPPHGVLDLAETPALTGTGRLLAGSWLGLYRSEDRGHSWQALAPAVGSPNIETLLATDQMLFLGTRTGLYRWDLSQRRWILQPGHLPAGIVSLAVGPPNPQQLYAGLVSDGLYRSQDGGINWQLMLASPEGVPVMAVDPQNSETIFILTPQEGIYASRDGGQTWDGYGRGQGAVPETLSLAVDPLTSTLYVGTELGLYRRHPNESWRLVAPALADQSILALLAQPDQNSPSGISLYIGATRGVYRSFDQGDTVEGEGVDWGGGLENISVTALLADPQDPRRFYAGTADKGVYSSRDGGRSWQPIGPADLTAGVVKSLAWGPAGEVFVATTDGVWSGKQE